MTKWATTSSVYANVVIKQLEPGRRKGSTALGRGGRGGGGVDMAWVYATATAAAVVVVRVRVERTEQSCRGDEIGRAHV